MSNRPTFGNGKICYIEIPALDIQTSANFYQKVFNWNIRQDQEGNASFDDGVGEVSGMWVLDRKPATEIGFIISIMVYNIHEAIVLVTANGGTVIYTQLEGREKIAHFTDPAGNIFGLYQHGG